jgi:hypothetical protein
MAYNFFACDRDQAFLLPPDLRDWLPEGHLAWFILDVIDQLDLAPFYLAHRDDGHGGGAGVEPGRRPHHPATGWSRGAWAAGAGGGAISTARAKLLATAMVTVPASRGADQSRVPEIDNVTM